MSAKHVRDPFNTPLMEYVNYNDLRVLKRLYGRLDELKQLSYMGDATALVVYCDLMEALNYTGLTNLQRECIQLIYIEGEKLSDVVLIMERDEVSIIDSINGGLKRLQAALVGGDLYKHA